MAHGKKKTALTLLIIFFLADALLIALVIQRYHAKASAPTEPEAALVLNPVQKEVGEQKFLTAAHMTYLPIAFSGSEGHVEILNNSTLYVEDGSQKILHITGEIANYTSSSISHVSINAVLYPANGTNAVATMHGSPLVTVLAPGQKACFHLYLQSPAKYERYELSIPGFQSGGEAAPTLNLANVSAGFDKNSRAYILSGQALATEEASVENLRVVATLYDAQGKVVGCDQGAAVTDSANPEVPGTFRISFASRAARSAREYKLDPTIQ
ncbi:MAG: FxLYD domain-containing protein [Anaerolineaceae bacterium]|mgnify:FL=1|jgi:hypothetical protein|nr:FxLYD domain-containing protein [Anaerolineaceae bacterium]HOE35836.1 FxLYD domain-containing protein [Anaerolineaceae bacterium]